MVSLQTSSRAGRLLLLTEQGTQREIYSAENGVPLQAMWIGKGQLVFRQRSDDEYQMFRLDVDTGLAMQVGPTQGVTYPQVFDRPNQRLWFAHSGERLPKRILSLDVTTNTAEVARRFDWIKPDDILETRRFTLAGDNPATVYETIPAAGDSDEAIIWLHGGSNSFSPRWHPIVQSFAHHDYSVFALNYATAWSLGKGAHPASWETSAQQVEALVTELYQRGFSSVHLLGVSTGTQVMQATLRRDNVVVASAIEFAPVHSEHWKSPYNLPPTLIVAGENDSGVSLPVRSRRVSKHAALGSQIKLHVLADEGHDLRRRAGISERLQVTLRHLRAISAAGKTRPTIVLDSGHSPRQPGATSASGRGEYWFNTDLRDLLSIRLQRLGFEVLHTDSSAIEMTLRQRSTWVAGSDADMLLSLHHDSVQQQFIEGEMNGYSYSRHARGYSLFVAESSPDSASYRLGATLGRALRSRGFSPSRHHADSVAGESRTLLEPTAGLYEFDGLLLLRTAAVPALLFEAGVLVHPEEELALRQPDVRRQLVDAIAEALVTFSDGLARSDWADRNRKHESRRR